MAENRALQEQIAERTDRIVTELREKWSPERVVEPFEYGPNPWWPDTMPESVDEVLDVFAGMASVVVFYTPERPAETVLVYKRQNYREPPGGAIEGRTDPATEAVREAREETGLDIGLTDLFSVGRVDYQYPDENSVRLPTATFVAERVGGSLLVEREVTDHVGVTRGVGPFTADVLPEDCRDREAILDLIEERES